MNAYKRSLILASFLFIAVVADAAFAQETTDSPISIITANETSRLIVSYKKYTPSFLRNQLQKKTSVSNLQKLRKKNAYLYEISPHFKNQALLLYNNSPWVEYVEEDAIATKFSTPEDEYYGEQWAIPTTQTDQVWEHTKGNTVTVAILDSGVAENHEDITPTVTLSVNFTRSKSVYDKDGHGTHVAGSVGALQNTIGISGMAPEVDILSAKVLDDRGRGYYSWIANGIYWAVDNDADIINLSLGGSVPSQTLFDAITYADNHNVLVVAAAGNTGDTRPHYPAYYDSVLAVTSTNQDNQLSTFATMAEWVDIAAPGEVILSTFPEETYAYYSGTSMSTPNVSGIAALLKATTPSLSNEQIFQTIVDTGTIINSSRGDIPLIQSYNAYLSLSSTPPVIPTPIPSTTPSPITSPTSVPTPQPTPSPTPTPTLLPSPTPTIEPSPSPSPTPSPSTKPWYCAYFPTARKCR